MRVALTGPDGDGGPLGEGLRAYGVETIGFPLLEVVLAEDVRPLETAVRGTGRGQPDFLAFTSPRAVDAVSLFEAGRRLRVSAYRTCFAVGPETGRRAREAGWNVVVAGEGPGAAGLLEALDRNERHFPVRGKRVLLPVSDRARTELEDGLRARGAEVVVVPVYTVRPVAGPEQRVTDLIAEMPDAAILASPSAAEAFAAGAGEERRLLPPLFAIGPTTAAAMEKLGLPVAGAAAKPTPLGLWTAMKERGMADESKGGFPAVRARRLRRTEAIRAMVRETRLSPDMLVAPMFVADKIGGPGEREPVPSMPGVSRVSPEAALGDARELVKLGVRSVILFGIPESKDEQGSGAWAEGGPVPRTIRLLKKECPDLVVWADVCLCEYTSHGHCGVLDEKGVVKNDESLPLLARAAVAYAKAGADAVAPSDMMDGRVRAIRTGLDREGLEDTLLVSYAVKYASGLYGPFRDAADSAPKSGDRKSYQMDPANVREALREAALDEAEGADMLIVKPALAYLDVIHRVREAVSLPVAAYNVSGEYAMVKAAAEKGWIDGDRVMMETLTSIRRAGADLILTYHAAEAARLLQ
jgi:porphobilinogen synthase